MPSKPRFSTTSKVFDLAAGKWAKVEQVFHDGQAWRYEVRHSGWLWSVPETSLASQMKRNFVPGRFAGRAYKPSV